MKTWLKRIGIALLSLVLLAALAVGGYLWYQNSQKFIKVLVFSKTQSFRHASIDAGKAALLQLGKQHGFAVDTTEDATAFNEANLTQYNVILFLNTTGDVLDDAQQLEMNRWVQAGGGYVGVHAAADTEYDWPWYGQLVGAYFESHPNDPNVRDAAIDVREPGHVCAAHLPARWERTDEWYNYKDIQPDINVVLNLDESSYEGGTNGDEHPIAWYHEFDNGRAWYTGLGHTDETYADPLFLNHLWGGIQYAAGPQAAVNYDNANVAPEENRFTKTVLADHLEEPMELEMLPNEDILFIQRGGAVRLHGADEDSLVLVHQFDVHTVHEDGLLGLALDPAFADNRWAYFFYSDPTESRQNVARWTMSEDYRSLKAGSEKVLLSIPVQREECCHSAGSMEFGPDGLLYIAAGDNTNPHASSGYNPTDERANRSPWDAQKSSANTQDLRGGVLRIKPEADGTYSIPDGNLFAEASEGRPEIYVMGTRNPYRISVDQRTGYLYWGDVGPDAGQDSVARGPCGYDEVNQARQAGFYGWPYFIGKNYPYKKYDFAQQVSQKEHDPAKPVNQSPNNTGAQNLPPAQPAFIYYPYAKSQEFKGTGEGGRNAMAGPVYYADAFPESDARYPEYYSGKLFVYDWMRGWIMAVTMDDNGDFVRMEPFLPNIQLDNPTDMIFGPDGDIYLLEYGKIWFSGNPDARLVHLQYTAGNRQPLAQIEADKTVGAAPLTVAFNGGSSKDFDGDALDYAWYISSEEAPDYTEVSPTHTFDKPGTYDVYLMTTDPDGLTSTAETQVYVGNELPELAWNFSGNQTFFWPGETLDYKVLVSDAEDGKLGSGIAPEQVAITIDYLERGYDENMIAMGHQAMLEQSQFALGKVLMDKADCAGCHQPAVQSVGPSYQAVAAKYKGDDKAEAYLAGRIISGGGGVWGETVMAAHPELSEGAARKMTRYILSLEGESAEERLRPSGNYAFTEAKADQQEGRYIFTASYTDKGGNGMQPLTQRQSFSLRAPYVQAVEHDLAKKANQFVIKPEMAPDLIKEDLPIMMANDGSVLAYHDIDLTGVGALTFDILKVGMYFKGGTLEIRTGSADGPLIATHEIEISLTDMGPGQDIVPIEPTTGKQDIYLLLRNGKEEMVTGVVGMGFERRRAG